MSELRVTPAVPAMTPEQADFAARFADYDIQVRVGTTTVDVEGYGDGQGWLVAGTIKILPHRRSIVVYVVADTAAKTMENMVKTAHDFRDGKAWHELLTFNTRHRDDGGEWFCSDELGRNVPTNYVKHGLRVTACTYDLCTENYHEYDDVAEDGTPVVAHLGKEIIEHPEGLYGISMVRETHKDWVLDVEARGYYEMNPFEARSFANDLNWMAIACEKLNSQSREVAA